MELVEIGLLANTIGGKIFSMSRDGDEYTLKIEVSNPETQIKPFILVKFTDFGWEIMKSEK